MPLFRIINRCHFKRFRTYCGPVTEVTVALMIAA